MRIAIDKFEEWLRNKNLKERSIENYIYYFNKFIYDVFTQETISKFLSDKTNRNSVARSFLRNFKKFLIVNYKELKLTPEARIKAVEVELPKLTGRTKKTLVKPLKHEDIALLESFLETEKLKLQLLISYYCALRLGELLKIKIVSFDWKDWGKDTTKMGECRVFGKGDKEGIALVPSNIMRRVAKYIKSNSFASLNAKIFITEPKDSYNFKNKSRLWQIRLREAGIKSGITTLDEKGKAISGT